VVPSSADFPPRSLAQQGPAPCGPTSPTPGSLVAVAGAAADSRRRRGCAGWRAQGPGARAASLRPDWRAASGRAQAHPRPGPRARGAAGDYWSASCFVHVDHKLGPCLV